jgi:hypothetical protein
MINGTIAPSAPNKTIIRGSGLEDFESFGRTALRGVATGKLSSAGPNGPVKRAPGLRSLCFGSLRKLASTFRNLSRHDRQGSLKGSRSQQRSTLFDECPSATRQILVLAGENRCAAPASQVHGRVFGPLIDFGPQRLVAGVLGVSFRFGLLYVQLSQIAASCPAGARFPRRKHFNPSSLDQSTCVPRRGSFYQGVI